MDFAFFAAKILNAQQPTIVNSILQWLFLGEEEGPLICLYSLTMDDSHLFHSRSPRQFCYMVKKYITIRGETFEILEFLKKDFFATNIVVAQNNKKYVLKISVFGLIARFFSQGIANILSCRERNLYKKLQHISGVPSIHPLKSRFYFLHEYIEGKNLAKVSTVPEHFFDDLEQLIAEVHKAGVAYMDLSKRENIIISPEGKPYLIDFQISLAKTQQEYPFAHVYNSCVQKLMKQDLYHIAKHKRKLCRNLMTERDWQLYNNKSLVLRIHQRFIRKPFLQIKRLIYPRGSNEGRWGVDGV